jgi:DNA primase
LLAALNAPVLAALLRRKLAAIAGLPEAELATLAPLATDAARRAPRATAATRGAPSLLRDLIKCVLAEPELVRKIDVPRPAEGDPDGAALAALIDFCMETDAPLTTAGIMQHFAGSPHDAVLLAALTTAESEGLSGESLETQLLEGVKHYWAMRRKRLDSPHNGAPAVELSPEEAERARQRRLVRARLADGAV